MTNSRPRVAIVGGGLAGMSAAIALREQADDLDITLYEARRLPGGRAGSFIDIGTGEDIDYCQHVAMGCCTHFLALMNNAGLLSAFTRYRELRFHHPRFAESRFASSALLPAPLHLLPSLLRLQYLSWRQRWEISWATFVLMQTRSISLTKVTAHQWLSQRQQSPATIRDYWNVVIASALGESCQHVSMAAARKVFIEGFLATKNACDVFLPKLPLSALFGVKLPGFVASKDVKIYNGTPVRSVAMFDNGSMLVNVNNENLEYGHVILAVPCFALARVLDYATAIAAGLPADRYESVPTSPITGIHLWFDRPIIDRPHAVMVGTLSQWVFRRDQDLGTTSPSGRHYVQVVISASRGVRDLSPEAVIDQVVAELRHAFPAAVGAKLQRGRVVTDRQAVYSVRPDVDAIRPSATTALPCLHLAGDFVQTGWPATMEGAVISGRLAASSLLKQLGRLPVSVDRGLQPSVLSRLLIRK